MPLRAMRRPAMVGAGARTTRCVLAAGTALCLSTVAGFLGHVHAAAPQDAARSGAASSLDRGALINRYCVTCHNERLRTGGLTLDDMDVSNVAAGAEVWEKVVKKLRSGVMPP